MKQTERSQSVGAVALGSVVVIVIIVASISTLDRSSQNNVFHALSPGLPTTASISTPESFNQNKAIPAQSTGLPTTIESNTITPATSGAQSKDFLSTQKAIYIATECRITRTPWPTQIPPPTGTSEDVRVKYTAEKLLGLDALNGWFGLVNGYEIFLYAGSLLDDPEQGAIAMPDEKYLTPTRHGGVRVVAEQNNRLTLHAIDGETFYFDVPARRFVDSLTEVVPTVTPPPTKSPLPPLSCTLLPEPPHPMPGTPMPDGNSYPMPGNPMPTYNPYPMQAETGTEAP